MTDDQHRAGQLTAAHLVVADALERWDARPPADRPQPIAVGAWVIDQLQNAGWTPPRSHLDDVPPLRPANVATDAQRAAHKAAIDAALRRTPA